MIGPDVLVVGGGPCGCAAALTLLRYTQRRVVLLEGSRYEGARPGETVSPALSALLRYLDAAAAIEGEERALPSYGSEGAWGGETIWANESLFTGRGTGFHLDRRRFDATLAELVLARGGQVIQGAWLRRIEGSAEGWRVRFDCEGRSGTAEAAQVIDASGRRAAFSRRAGARVHSVDRLVAISCEIELRQPTSMTHSTLVETVEDGWWYSAPLPRGRAVLSFMSDADLLARSRMSTEAFFRDRLAISLATGARMEGGGTLTSLRVAPAQTQYLDHPLGKAWVAAGDAAIALDPLSSLGIGQAISSGIQAARIADGRLRGCDTLAASYAADTHAHLYAFLVRRRDAYSAERRWAQSPFWQRRHDTKPLARAAQVLDPAASSPSYEQPSDPASPGDQRAVSTRAFRFDPRESTAQRISNANRQ